MLFAPGLFFFQQAGDRNHLVCRGPGEFGVWGVKRRNLGRAATVVSIEFWKEWGWESIVLEVSRQRFWLFRVDGPECAT